MRKVLIPWSGGWDSTYLILYCISNNIEFDTCYLTLENNKPQQNIEKENRSLLKVLIEKEFGYHWNDVTYNFVSVISANHPPSTQPFIWLSSLVFNVNPQKYKKILFGYLETSHIWHNLKNLKKAFKASSKIIWLYNYKKIKLEYPLEWCDKKTVVSYVKDYFGDMYPFAEFLLTTCENPKNGSACGQCEKCEEIKEFII